MRDPIHYTGRALGHALGVPLRWLLTLTRRR